MAGFVGGLWLVLLAYKQQTERQGLDSGPTVIMFVLHHILQYAIGNLVMPGA